MLGKFVGGLTALVGVFTITLPIPIVVNSFAGFYKNRLWRNEVALKKRQRVSKEREIMKKEIEERVFRGELDINEVRFEQKYLVVRNINANKYFFAISILENLTSDEH